MSAASFQYFSPSLMLFQGCERKGKRRFVMETINCSVKKDWNNNMICLSLILLFCWRMIKFALPLTRIIQIGCLRSIWPIGRQRTGDPLRVSPICHHMDSQSDVIYCWNRHLLLSFGAPLLKRWGSEQPTPFCKDSRMVTEKIGLKL